jgi:UDP:flavonoid glycosyltransferase YjiC (YdhE family)
VLRDAVHAVLSEPAYRERAALLRQSIRARETESTA